MPETAPAGWYPGPDGIPKYWNGSAWTASAPPPPPGFRPPHQAPYPPHVVYGAYGPAPYGGVPYRPGPYAVGMRPPKDVGIAYVFWLLLGCAGGHRFYLGRTGSAVGQLALFVFGLLTLVVLIGVLFLLAAFVWAVVDAFLLPGMVEDANARERSGFRPHGPGRV